MSGINVVEVDSSGQLKQFIKYPIRLYKGDANYVAPLIMERLEFFDLKKNPFFRTAKVKLFLAMQDGKVTGRIATCINFNHNQYHSELTGFFGFFDCPDNYEIASTLLKVAMITIKKEGMETMRGPTNFSTNHECGFLVDGFDSPPMLMMTYNRPYLPRLAEKFGLKKAMDLMAYFIDSKTGVPPRIQRVANKLKERAKITLRSINMKDFDNEIQRVREIYNNAWQYNWGFIPIEDDEFLYMAQNMKQILEPDLVLIAEHEGKPVAFSLALPDINQALIYLKGRLFPFGLPRLLWHTKIRNKINRARLVTFGVIPQFQKRGIDSLLFVETFNRGVSKGYKQAELSWILESNELMRSGSVQMGAHLYKKYRILEMPL